MYSWFTRFELVAQNLLREISLSFNTQVYIILGFKVLLKQFQETTHSLKIILIFRGLF